MTTKNYFKIAMLLIVIGVLASCSNNNGWNRLGLHGKVKTYLERYYKAEMKFGEWTNGDIEYYGHNRVSFDSEGNCQWIEFLDDDNELSSKTISKIESGEIVGEAHYDEYGDLISKTEIISNSKDESELIEYDKDGEKIAHVTIYFANNRVIKKQYQTFEDNKVKKEYVNVWEYDKDGNLASVKEIDKNGKILHFSRFEYLAFDELKNWTKRLVYDSENSKEPKYVVIREYEYY